MHLVAIPEKKLSSNFSRSLVFLVWIAFGLSCGIEKINFYSAPNISNLEPESYWSSVQNSYFFNAPRAIVLGQKIPFQTASVQDLSVIPGLGKHRASLLVVFRERSLSRGERFMMDQVPGIGPKTEAALKRYLTFE